MRDRHRCAGPQSPHLWSDAAGLEAPGKPADASLSVLLRFRRLIVPKLGMMSTITLEIVEFHATAAKKDPLPNGPGPADRLPVVRGVQILNGELEPHRRGVHVIVRSESEPASSSICGRKAGRGSRIGATGLPAIDDGS